VSRPRGAPKAAAATNANAAKKNIWNAVTPIPWTASAGDTALRTLALASSTHRLPMVTAEVPEAHDHALHRAGAWL
jgi:hypothetical protein